MLALNMGKTTLSEFHARLFPVPKLTLMSNMLIQRRFKLANPTDLL